MDAGLCYETCKSGYHGVGPVCWMNTPTVKGVLWKDCGAGCAADDTTCGLVTTDMILGPLEVIVFFASLGSSSSAAAATAGAKAGKKTAMQAAKKAALALQDVFGQVNDAAAGKCTPPCAGAGAHCSSSALLTPVALPASRASLYHRCSRIH